MSNSALRRELAKALKENGYGKLYTCPKHQAYRWLRAHNMRSMIRFLKIKPGMVIYDYGVNQKVKTIPSMVAFNSHYASIKRGYVYHLANQVEYESGFLSCGCGAYGCFEHDDAFRQRSKSEIVENFHKGINEEWASSLSKLYFKSLENGLDIIDDDGFLIVNWRKFE